MSIKSPYSKKSPYRPGGTIKKFCKRPPSDYPNTGRKQVKGKGKGRRK